MPAHIIRLVGPWEIEWLEPPHGNLSQRGQMPRDWQSLFGDSAGRARFSRRFQQPTNLDADERVILEFTGIRGTGKIMLNGGLVGEIASDQTVIAFDITDVLQPRNVLIVELGFDPHSTMEPGGLYDVVRLVITSE